MKTKPVYEKLWYIYLLCIIFPLIALAAVFTLNTSRRITEDNRKMNSNMLASISDNIETLVTEMKQCTIQWVNSSEITDFYKKVSTNDGVIPKEPIGLKKEYLVSSRNILLNSSSQILGIGFYPLSNADHLYYNITTREDNVQICSDYDIEGRGWFEQAVSLHGSAILTAPVLEPYYGDDGRICFSVARLAYNVDTKSVYGIVKVDASVEYFDDLFSSLDFGDSSGVILTTRSGEIIYSANSELNQIISVSDGGIISNDSDYTINEEMIQDTDWCLVFVSSKADLFRDTRVIILTTFTTGLITLLISLLLFSLGSKQLTDPMNLIVSTMHSAETGDLKTRIAVNPSMPTEFYKISTEYNLMLDKLERLIDSEYKAKISQQRAEFSVLQTQINPHFLYNILNNFLALNRMGYKEELEDSIIALTELFRYTSGKGHERTVSDELKFIERYLQLQHLRFSDRLEYTIFLDESVSDYHIPKLILQPIVENSIVHGVEPIDRCVHISISAVSETSDGRNWLCFTVSDDGAGVCAEEFISKKGRIGMQNIQSRLQLLSKESVFNFESFPDAGATTTIKIPSDDLERLKNENHFS